MSTELKSTFVRQLLGQLSRRIQPDYCASPTAAPTMRAYFVQNDEHRDPAYVGAYVDLSDKEVSRQLCNAGPVLGEALDAEGYEMFCVCGELQAVDELAGHAQVAGAFVHRIHLGEYWQGLIPLELIQYESRQDAIQRALFNLRRRITCIRCVDGTQVYRLIDSITHEDAPWPCNEVAALADEWLALELNRIPVHLDASGEQPSASPCSADRLTDC